MSRRSERANSIPVSTYSNSTAVEFTVDHVFDIRSAIVCLLDAVASMVESYNTSPPESYINLSQQLFALDEKLFKGIRDRYLWWTSTFIEQSGFSKLSRKLPHSAKPAIQTTSHHGFAIRYSRAEADRFLQCLLVGFEACKEAMLQSLKKKSEKESTLYHQVLSLKNQIDQCEAELSISRDKLDDVRRERDNWICKLEEMTEKLKVAEEKIFQLENDRDVLKWQKYSDQSSQNQVKALDNVKKLYDEREKVMNVTKENLINKIKRLESELGKLRLRNEIPLNHTPTPVMEKLDHAKQQLYVRDQEIHMLHKRMLEQQKLTVGCLHGLQEDFKSLLGKLEYDNPGRAFSPDSNSVQFQAKLRLLHEACLDGTLHEASSTLPSHYAPTESECTPPIKPIKHGSINLNKPTLNNPLLDMNKPRSVSVGRKFPIQLATNCRINPLEQRNLHKFSRHTIALPQNPLTTPNNLHHDRHCKGRNDHPQLVNPITGRANLLEVMKHFPYLTVDQVSQQWENFRKYDKNRDMSLDLPELYEVITHVCGLKVTVSEMKEAMAEVDRDKSNNVDFFEYLKIAEMIVKKQGNAALFQLDLVQGRGSTVSKACVIQ